jgi:hypothetical protein
LQSENRFYKYDFLYDNCTTRLRDLVETASGNTIKYKKIVKKPATFRNHIHEYVNRNNMPWVTLGMDLLLGSKTDAIMSIRETMFLPDYLMKSLEESTLPNGNLVQENIKLSKSISSSKSDTILNRPLVVISIFLFLIALCGYSDSRSIQAFINGFDGFIFFITGLLGLLIIFMWAGTDHLVCRSNYNILWALPTHIIGAFYVNSVNSKTQFYFKFVAAFYILVLSAWFFLPQQMNAGFLPIIIFLLYRSFIIGFRKPALNY